MASVASIVLMYSKLSLAFFLISAIHLNGWILASDVKDVASVHDVTDDDENIDVNVGKHLQDSVNTVHGNTASQTLKLICHMLPCSDWSVWSSCNDVIGRFGTRSRTRQCGYNITELCEEGNNGLEQDISDCMIDIPWCPLDYTYTRNGFCVKLYSHLYKSWYDAQIHCETDGGHLVNIDTSELSDDLDESFRDLDILSVYAWIDGIRRLSDSDWEFKSGLKTPKFTNWYRDHPVGDIFPNCKCVIRAGSEGTFEWRSSYVCGNRENFICQIKE